MKEFQKVRRPCPVCGSRDESIVFVDEKINPEKLDSLAFSSRKIPENMYHRMVVCPECDLLYANPLPRKGEIFQGYQEADFESSEESHFAARTYARYLPEIIRHIPGTHGALDIGTGDGAFLEELLKHGMTGVVGIEPSRAPVKASRPEIKPLIRNRFFRPRDFRKNSMSLVSCFQTFEHLYDPEQMIRGVHAILREGGAFLAVSHNRKSLSARLMGLKSPIYDIEHLQLFSPRSIQYFFEKAGFVGVRVESLFNVYPLHYWIKLFPLPKGMKLFLMKFLKRVGIGYLPIPLPAGNMAIIGYKKHQ